MKHTLIVTPAGEEMVLISKADFDQLEDLLDVAAYDAAKAEFAASGGETLTLEEVKAALDAPTPLAFWRAKRGMKQKDLATAVGVSQSYVADLEGGRRNGDGALIKRLARALRVRMDDLVVDSNEETGEAN